MRRGSIFDESPAVLSPGGLKGSDDVVRSVASQWRAATTSPASVMRRQSLAKYLTGGDGGPASTAGASHALAIGISNPAAAPLPSAEHATGSTLLATASAAAATKPTKGGPTRSHMRRMSNAQLAGAFKEQVEAFKAAKVWRQKTNARKMLDTYRFGAREEDVACPEPTPLPSSVFETFGPPTASDASVLSRESTQQTLSEDAGSRRWLPESPDVHPHTRSGLAQPIAREESFLNAEHNYLASIPYADPAYDAGRGDGVSRGGPNVGGSGAGLLNGEGRPGSSRLLQQSSRRPSIVAASLPESVSHASLASLGEAPGPGARAERSSLAHAAGLQREIAERDTRISRLVSENEALKASLQARDDTVALFTKKYSHVLRTLMEARSHMEHVNGFLRSKVGGKQDVDIDAITRRIAAGADVPFPSASHGSALLDTVDEEEVSSAFANEIARVSETIKEYLVQ